MTSLQQPIEPTTKRKRINMTDDKFKNKYRIQSARAAWHDYSGGTYFVTICTKNREHYFGEIVYDQKQEAKMDFSEMGDFTEKCIAKMETLHNDIDVPLWVVMPNHIHLLVIVKRDVELGQNGQNAKSGQYAQSVETPYYDVSTTNDVSTNDDPTNAKKIQMKNIANQCGRLSHIISRFKTAVTKYAREKGIYFRWQSRFHDHIVRDWDELNRISDYIEHNPDRWAQDIFNTDGKNVETS